MKTLKISVFSLCAVFSLSLWASTEQQDFDAGTAYGESQVSSAMSAIAGFSGSDTWGDAYTTTPPQTAYSNNSDTMESDGATVAANDPASQAVVEGYINNPETPVDESTIQQGEAIEQNAPATVEQSNSFCTSGDCKDTQTTPSDDFDEGGSELSGVASAGEDVQKEQENLNVTNPNVASNLPVSSYRGASKECTYDPVSFKNCCADSGWGKNTGLASCSDSEKKLGTAKQEHRAVYVGTYCSKKLPLIGCVEKKQVYCQFDSLLSRIIQTDGRVRQLPLSFGTVNDDNHTANCRGIYPDEMERIDFDQCSAEHPSPRCIDYTEYYTELEESMTVPSSSDTAAEVNKSLEEYYGG